MTNRRMRWTLAAAVLAAVGVIGLAGGSQRATAQTANTPGGGGAAGGARPRHQATWRGSAARMRWNTSFNSPTPSSTVSLPWAA